MPALYSYCSRTVQSFTLNRLIIFKYLYITVLSIHFKTAYPCVYINICINPSSKLSDLPHSVAHTQKCSQVLQLSDHSLPKTLCSQLPSPDLSLLSEIAQSCFCAAFWLLQLPDKQRRVHTCQDGHIYTCMHRLLLCVPGAGNAQQSCRRTPSSTRKVMHP